METDKNTTPENKGGEIAGFHDEIRGIQLEGYELGVKKARNALFWAAGLIAFWETIGLIRNGAEPDAIVLVVLLLIIGSFVALGLWTKKKPFTAIIIGIAVFIGYILLNVLAFWYVEGATGVFKALFSGIIVKVLILVALIRPLKDAKELQQEIAERKAK